MESMERVKTLLDGRIYKNLLNGNVYKVSRIANSRAAPDSLDGKSQILTDLDNLKIFYRKMDSYRDGV